MLDTFLYILGNAAVISSLYADWIHVLFLPHNSFHRIILLLTLLTGPISMVFGPLKTFFYDRFRNPWFLPDFTIFERVLYKPSSNSSGWYFLSNCPSEVRTELQRYYSLVSKQLTDVKSVVMRWCKLFSTCFSIAFTSFISLWLWSISVSFAPDVKNISSAKRFACEIFPFHDVLRFDHAHTHSIP